MSKIRLILLAVLLLVAVGFPLVIDLPYALHILILTCIYLVLALSYDLVAGHVGLLSLAHPAFFGTGAYVAAILSTRFGTPFLVNLIMAGLVAGGLSFIIGIPSFRLTRYTFAMGTLGFAVIVQSLAQNWIDLTRGPMCITPVPRPSFSLPFTGTLRISSLQDYYYLILAIVVITILLYHNVVASRVGRVFAAIREHELLSQSFAINPLQYKMLAFFIGAFLAGVVGTFYVQYLTIVCPGDLSLGLTIELLIIVFLGGVASLRGIIIGSVIFTVVPELLRITPELRLVIYGVLLYLAILYMPRGLEGLVEKQQRRLEAWLRSRLGRADNEPKSP